MDFPDKNKVKVIKHIRPILRIKAHVTSFIQ